MTIQSLAIDSQFLSDQKEIIRDRIIPWEGLSRANVITDDELNYIKILDKQSIENKKKTIGEEVKLYSNFLLNLLNKLDNNPREDVLKNLLCLFNDLLLDVPEFSEELIKLNAIDQSFPFEPFLKVLGSNDNVIKSLSLYNLVILLTSSLASITPSDEVLVKVFHELAALINNDDVNYKFVNIQLLQHLIISKPFKLNYANFNLLKNFKCLNNLINFTISNKQFNNSSNLSLIYNTVLTIWILSFNSKANKLIYLNYPELITNLLILANESLKLNIIRISISILKNLVSITETSNDKFKIIKIILHNDGLNLIHNLKNRKISSNGSDEELTNDLNYLYDELNDVVKNKLTSFEEYLTELENPKLLNWSSPTHKSAEFWLENSGNFKSNSWSLVKKVFSILTTNFDDATTNNLSKIILLNDLQFLIDNLGQDLITFINSNKDYKLLIMNLLDNNSDTELKYQALKTIQLLVGHNY